MADVSEDDLERLASRLAMVVSEDGEAENAGRAMGQLARRLGLTGGHLKEMFLAGAAARGPAQRQLRRAAAEAERLEREVAALRQSLRLMETNWRSAERERDALQYEVAALRTTVFKSRTASQTRLVMATVILLAVIAAAAISYLVPLGETTPAVPPLPAAAADPAATMRRMGVVRSVRATVFQQPDRAAPVMATLQAGMPVVVRRLVWSMLMQWAEVEVGSSVGYVLTTDIDLS
ncbi:SH3 domain-containing protein [Limobrevibacterium gyesilva]|uniref:SH3 domain-containing protein n=1 Tax=Limobrevibacterium gyesilva TaxID=2991712 RepID=A0AA42CFJ1_9PROT|nr:hypothetical protein [Limobrevibacterium gyesilva]MCW3473027.1 hypothetical protein [Limobrevibacterium gyesilva]